jgi:hypothetical protein
VTTEHIQARWQEHDPARETRKRTGDCLRTRNHGRRTSRGIMKHWFSTINLMSALIKILNSLIRKFRVEISRPTESSRSCKRCYKTSRIIIARHIENHVPCIILALDVFNYYMQIIKRLALSLLDFYFWFFYFLCLFKSNEKWKWPKENFVCRVNIWRPRWVKTRAFE